LGRGQYGARFGVIGQSKQLFGKSAGQMPGAPAVEHVVGLQSQPLAFGGLEVLERLKSGLHRRESLREPGLLGLQRAFGEGNALGGELGAAEECVARRGELGELVTEVRPRLVDLELGLLHGDPRALVLVAGSGVAEGK